jgi:hypothetical protein
MRFDVVGAVVHSELFEKPHVALISVNVMVLGFCLCCGENKRMKEER